MPLWAFLFFLREPGLAILVFGPLFRVQKLWRRIRA
jgi:hypothetical protein